MNNSVYKWLIFQRRFPAISDVFAARKCGRQVAVTGGPGAAPSAPWCTGKWSGRHSSYKNGHRSNNLVGGWPTPVKNMSQLGWWHSQLNGKTVPNHQPVIDNRFWYHQWTFLRGLLDGKLCARSWNPLYKWAIFHFFPICIPQNPIKSTINGGYPRLVNVYIAIENHHL